MGWGVNKHEEPFKLAVKVWNNKKYNRFYEYVFFEKLMGNRKPLSQRIPVFILSRAYLAAPLVRSAPCATMTVLIVAFGWHKARLAL